MTGSCAGVQEFSRSSGVSRFHTLLGTNRRPSKVVSAAGCRERVSSLSPTRARRVLCSGSLMSHRVRDPGVNSSWASFASRLAAGIASSTASASAGSSASMSASSLSARSDAAPRAAAFAFSRILSCVEAARCSSSRDSISARASTRASARIMSVSAMSGSWRSRKESWASSSGSKASEGCSASHFVR